MRKYNIYYKALLILFAAHLAAVNAYGQKAVYRNWISAEYLLCLQNELPCECQKKVKYSVIRLDSSLVTIHRGIIYDPEVGRLRTIATGLYEVHYPEYEPTYNNQETEPIIGILQLARDSLFLFDTTGAMITFAHYGSPADGQWTYGKEHVSLLNKALVARQYPALEEILSADSLRCNCNPELGDINLVWSGSQYWILETEGDKLLIYEWTNAPDEKIADLKIEKRLIKTYRW